MSSLTETDFEALMSQMEGFLEQLYPLEGVFLQEGLSAIEDDLKTIRAKVKAAGMFAPHMAKEVGGMGLSLIEHAKVSELLGRSPLGHYLFNCQAPDAGNMELLHLYANHEQEEKFLKPLVAGECRSAFAMTEPEHAGSNPLWLSTTAVLEGDDYVVNGHKWFSTGFDGSSFLILMTITNPEARKAHERASMLIIPNDTPGLIHVRKVKIMGEAGEGNHSHSELRFENCRVPQKNLLGKEGEGFLLAQQRLGPGRIHHCMRWIGICNRAFEMLCQRAATREISPGRVLGQKQSVQNWIAESKAEIQAARLMVLDAAEQMAQKGSKGARIEISLIKFFVADVLMKVLDRAIQAHGALGISDDILLSFWYRHERGARIYDGADEVHKQVVAREILREYGVRLEP
ncbi:MAG: acyl-CoA dehydrogenase family protein [Deinococcales bacterium]